MTHPSSSNPPHPALNINPTAQSSPDPTHIHSISLCGWGRGCGEAVAKQKSPGGVGGYDITPCRKHCPCRGRVWGMGRRPKNTRVTPSATPPIASSPTDLAFRILCPPATGGGVEAGRGIGLSRVGGEVRGRSRREHEEPLVGSYGVWARLGNDGRDTRTPLTTSSWRRIASVVSGAIEPSPR